MAASLHTLRRAALLLGALALPPVARAGIDGESGTSFTVTAREGYISTPEGGSIYSWGYTTGAEMQLPGPTLIVEQGDTVQITLRNELPVAAGNVSMVFPGLKVRATGGRAGSLTREAATGGTVTYEVVADEPGTYQYHSGTRPDLQVEMGLYGAIIVRPSAPAPACAAAGQRSAYAHDGSCYDREYLFLLSEIDLEVHTAAEAQADGLQPIDVGEGPFQPDYWLLNGRLAPDTLAPGRATLPHQPYAATAYMHPGERVLARVVGAGRDPHPFHFHGNHVRVLAQDGHMLVAQSDPSQLAGPWLYTVPSTPGSTFDALFQWTGQGLGWDIYGHSASDPIEDGEWAADHGKPLPVDLPGLSDLTFGGFYSGSPYLGAMGALPPGEGGLNPDAGYTYMWHSHTERELINNDVFPGGMMTMMIILPPWVAIP
jgi:FtsP/CotA-like multicopper oxidase with cupredoxin domain